MKLLKEKNEVSDVVVKSEKVLAQLENLKKSVKYKKNVHRKEKSPNYTRKQKIMKKLK